jgi:hypothetical protein
MTNKEIKFELAKVALIRCNFMASETLTEGLRNLYEWITEEPEPANDGVENYTEHNNKPIDEILRYMAKKRHGHYYATKLEKVFNESNIKTVGDLMRIGILDFSKYGNIGKGSITHIDDALEELYGIKNW